MGRITRRDVLSFSKQQLVSKLSGQFDRISGKIREFRDLSDTAGSDYTSYVKNFISDKHFNDKGTLNKGRATLSKMSVSELRKVFMKTLAIGESTTMKTVKSYTKSILQNERDLSATIQTQMEGLGISNDIIDTFLKDTKQVFKFHEMLKVHKNVYNKEILKTFTEYADTDNIEYEKNMNRMLKAYEKKQKDKQYYDLFSEREAIVRQISNGDYSSISRLQEIQSQMDDIRGNDIR